MSPLQSDQAAFLRAGALRTLRSEQPLTQRVIEAIPPAKGDYRPDEVGKSALDLSWHIVSAEHRFLQAVITGGFDFSNPGRPSELTDTAEVARWYAATSQRDYDALAGVPVDALLKVIDFRGIFQLPAVAFLEFSIHHVIHHRGQLSMYLRPMGAKVPAIYGESYDSAQAKAGA